MKDSAEFMKMLQRMLKAGAKRAGIADEHELKAFADLRFFLDEQLTIAVNMQLDEGKSWADIGYALGVTRQAAFKKFRRNNVEEVA